MITLISGSPEIDFVYRHEVDGRLFVLDTREVKQMLAGVSIASNEVLTFLRQMMEENIREIDFKYGKNINQ